MTAIEETVSSTHSSQEREKVSHHRGQRTGGTQGIMARNFSRFWGTGAVPRCLASGLGVIRAGGEWVRE